MYSYEITQVFSEEQVKPFRDAIEGKSFMNFQVHLCPCGGGFMLTVESDYKASQKEITGMLISLMFQAICDKK
jgi:hypothetical protein